MYDANDSETTNATECTRSVYNITVRRLISG